MRYNYSITNLPSQLKCLISLFVIILSIGYFSALAFVNETTASSSSGIIENYVGNESNEDAEVMKFKKSQHEMLNIIHTHILSMSMIFFVLALLIYGCNLNTHLKSFLMFEPMISVIVTFTGIYGVWLGLEWLVFIVMLSGALMSISFGLSVIIILYQLHFKNKI